jgi:hypothetical protein
LTMLREEQASDKTTKARSLLGQRVDHGCCFWYLPLLRADDGHLRYATAPTFHSKQSKEVNAQGDLPRTCDFSNPPAKRASEKCVVGCKVK